jgi:hypothetical protein
MEQERERGKCEKRNNMKCIGRIYFSNGICEFVHRNTKTQKTLCRFSYNILECGRNTYENVIER